MVTNLGDTGLTNVKVVDDNGTPNDPSDDIVLTVPTSGDRATATAPACSTRTRRGSSPRRLARAVAGAVHQRRHRHGHVGRRHLPRQRPGDATSAGSRRSPSQKATNAVDPRNPTALEDGNTAPGQILPIGTPVVWTYRVLNTGNIALVVSLNDDFGTAANAADDFTPVGVLSGGFNVGDTNNERQGRPGRDLALHLGRRPELRGRWPAST